MEYKFIFSRDGPKEVSIETLLAPDSPNKKLCLRDEEYSTTLSIGDDLTLINPEHLRKIEKLHCGNPFNRSLKKGKLLEVIKSTLENLESLKYFQSWMFDKPVGGPLLEALTYRLHSIIL